MLLAKVVHGQAKLAEMIVLCSHPYMPTPEVLGDEPFLIERRHGKITEYFCFWHQFSVYVRQSAHIDMLQFSPGWHDFDPQKSQKELAVCTLTGVFSYLPGSFLPGG